MKTRTSTRRLMASAVAAVALSFGGCGGGDAGSSGSATKAAATATTGARLTAQAAGSGSRLVVRARGSLAQGQGPLMQVWINGQQVTQRDVSNTDYADFAIDVPAGVGAITAVSLVFPNDAWANGEDRNLYIASITVDGRVNAVNAPNVYYDLGAVDGVDVIPGQEAMLWTGAMYFDLSAVAPPPPPTGPGLGRMPDNPRLNAGVGVDQISFTSEQPAPSGDQTGDFRTRCQPSHYAPVDPLVFPGQLNASHIHVFFGNTGADQNSTDQSLRTTGNSTCRGGTANRSSYWVPAMIDMGSGLPVDPAESDFYYKSGYMGVSPASIQPMPEGLRMIAGSAANSSDIGVENSHYTWVCHNTGINRGQRIPDCPVGDLLELSIAFPQCWDGVNLNSPDHKSHMAYGLGENRGCPSSHPVPLPEVSFHVLWPITQPGQTANWRLSSDVYADSAAGYSAHADWFNGWKKDISDAWGIHCVRAGVDCHSHLLGDGRMQY